jgi:hypothetical protein
MRLYIYYLKINDKNEIKLHLIKIISQKNLILVNHTDVFKICYVKYLPQNSGCYYAICDYTMNFVALISLKNVSNHRELT